MFLKIDGDIFFPHTDSVINFQIKAYYGSINRKRTSSVADYVDHFAGKCHSF